MNRSLHHWISFELCSYLLLSTSPARSFRSIGHHPKENQEKGRCNRDGIYSPISRPHAQYVDPQCCRSFGSHYKWVVALYPALGQLSWTLDNLHWYGWLIPPIWQQPAIDSASMVLPRTQNLRSSLDRPKLTRRPRDI